MPHLTPRSIRIRQQLLARSPLIVCAVALACGLLTACATPFTGSIPTAALASTATPTPSLPSLTAERGWHIVLTLGNLSGKYVNTGGSFVARKPYSLTFSCEGSGTLHITYPAATETAPCRETPERNGTQEFPPPVGDGRVTVQVSTEGTVLWEAIAEMQD